MCLLIMCLILLPRYLFVSFCWRGARFGRAVRELGLGVDVLEHQLGIFQNQKDSRIWLGLYILQFVWQFDPGLWCGRGGQGIIPHRSSNHVWFTFGWITPPPHGVCGRRWGRNARMIEGSSMDLSAGSYSKN
ncbi:uncharacterized protein BDCG_16148 [Blastomyces dermatitidis ER-3]|uniref:Secreted protein n=1 Tax=Ajellomyces dermatitidis (strain ER-3 / ATCC MYA-2586) TaxID=559297 RepID=A0ABP2EKH1_AJEDR|nr:uncharacterized protein BDCG_16148 [Blastomyces dermatitidis ER-3]EEQ83661.2 hypothetical protein BDCG_16148 [Blastomyces dermatitidis ER-3]